MSTTEASSAATAPLVGPVRDGLRVLADLFDPDHEGISPAPNRSVLVAGFNVDSSRLRDHHRDTLEAFAAAWRALPAERRPELVAVLGRASQTGSFPTAAERREHNQALSVARAEAVLAFLRGSAAAGGGTRLPAEVLDDVVVVGLGEDLPWEHTPAQENPLNRSVELVLRVPLAPPEPPVATPTGTPWGELRVTGSVLVDVMVVIDAITGAKTLLVELAAKKLLKEAVGVKAGMLCHAVQVRRGGVQRDLAIIGAHVGAGVSVPLGGPLNALQTFQFSLPVSDSWSPVHLYDGVDPATTLEDLAGVTWSISGSASVVGGAGVMVTSFGRTAWTAGVGASLTVELLPLPAAGAQFEPALCAVFPDTGRNPAEMIWEGFGLVAEDLFGTMSAMLSG